MKVDTEELTKFVHSFIEGIENGLNKDYHISPDNPIEFELAVINKQEIGGGLKIFVADAKGKHIGENTSKVKFKVSKKKPKLSISMA